MIDGLWCNDTRDHSIPHLFFVERPPDYQYRKNQDEFYHVRKKDGNDA